MEDKPITYLNITTCNNCIFCEKLNSQNVTIRADCNVPRRYITRSKQTLKVNEFGFVYTPAWCPLETQSFAIKKSKTPPTPDEQQE